jgi:hypothetical protein
MKTNIHSLSYLAHFFLEWEMCRTKVVDNIKTHILCSVNPPPPKIMQFVRECGKVLYKVGQATDDNMAQAQCKLDN